IAYSVLLGACGGVLIADYWVLRRTHLDPAGLYRREGPYWYRAGWNPAALVALVVGMAPCLPGAAAAVGLVKVPELLVRLYEYAWFVSFGVSFVTYLALMMTAGWRYGAVIAPYVSGRRSRENCQGLRTSRMRAMWRAAGTMSSGLREPSARMRPCGSQK